MKTLEELMEERRNIDSKINEYRKIEIEKKRNQVKAKIESMTEDKKQLLLSMMEHDRSSCSDDNPCNGFLDYTGECICRKCMLIDIFNGANGTDFDFEVDVAIYPVDPME